MKAVILLIFLGLLQACGLPNYDSKKNLTQTEYDHLLLNLAPYVNKKPKKATFPERFSNKYHTYYTACIKGQEANIPYYYTKDSIHYFYYVNKDLSSLYEHYKGYGGTFTKTKDGNIQQLNIIFTTPRFTSEEVAEKGELLFAEMVNTGDVATYKGKREYVHLPNADFEYDRQENRWVYTENSSWNFLKEAREENE